MKTINLIILIFCSLIFSSYEIQAQQKKKTAKKKHAKHKHKKAPAAAVPTFTLSGKILIVNNYCGGVAPTQELLNSIREPQPCLEKYFFLKKGEANSAKNPVIDVIHIDSTGSFSVQLKKGTYCVIQDFQTKPLKLDNYKESENFKFQGDDCMRKYWSDCYQTIELNQNINDLIITTYKKCFGDGNPCMLYTGPMRP